MTGPVPTVEARDLSCQALDLLDPDTLTWHGQPVKGFFAELARRGEDHVRACSDVGHIPPLQPGYIPRAEPVRHADIPVPVQVEAVNAARSVLSNRPPTTDAVPEALEAALAVLAKRGLILIACTCDQPPALPHIPHRSWCPSRGRRPVSEPVGTVLIWSNERQAWWRANSAGYTTVIQWAGHYQPDTAAGLIDARSQTTVHDNNGQFRPTTVPNEVLVPVPPGLQRPRPDAPAMIEVFEALVDQSSLPAHLRDDAPNQRCSGCGRHTWSTAEFGAECRMPQPDGKPCGGRFEPAA